MWIVPVPAHLSSQFDSEWLNESGNDIFLFQSWSGSSVLHKLGLTENDYRYRIMWRTGSLSNPELFMIACGNNKEEMVKGWVWLNENIVATISADVDSQVRDTAIMARLSDVLPNDEHSVLTSEVQSRVAKLFGVMEEDILLHTKANLVGCPKRGILTLSTSRLTFFSPDENANLQVSLGEIEENKVTGNLLFGPSLTIKTKRSSTFSFTSLSPLTPYEIDNMINELKSTAMRAIITGHSAQSPSKSRLHRSRTSTGSMDSLHADPIKVFFKLHPQSTLIGTYSSPQVVIQCRIDQKKEERLTSVNCQIYLYSQWLCLRAPKLSFAIPLLMITAVSKSNVSMLGKASANVLFKIDNDFGPSVIKLTAVPKGHELYLAASHHTNTPPPCSREEFVDISLETPDSFVKPLWRVIKKTVSSPTYYGAKEDELEVLWTDYLHAALMQNEGRSSLVLTTDMRRMIWKHGIPHDRRSTVWPVLANVIYNEVPEDLLDRYRLELEKAEDSVELSIVEEIERDLRRSLPEHYLFKDTRGLAALKRVLLISSHRNGLHGYTQAMNMIAAILLIHLPEPIAVEVMSKCTLEWLPDTYSKSMLGGAVDQRVFEEVLCQQFSDYADMISKSGDVAVITFGWFVAWFANLLNIENEVRFFDVFLMEGPVAIYWFGLAVFKVAFASISTTDTDSEHLVLAVNDVFRRMKTNKDLFSNILYQAFENYSSKFPLEAMLAAKDRHSSIALRHMSDRARAGDLKRLAKLHPSLSAQELETIYDVAVSTISSSSCSNKSLLSIDSNCFKTISRQLIPWTIQFGTGIVSKLIEYCQTDNNTTIDKIVDIVYKTSKASPEEQASFYFDLMKPVGLEKSQFIGQNASQFVQCTTITHLF